MRGSVILLSGPMVIQDAAQRIRTVIELLANRPGIWVVEATYPSALATIILSTRSGLGIYVDLLNFTAAHYRRRSLFLSQPLDLCSGPY